MTMDEVIETLTELEEDFTVPKNVKQKISNIKSELKSDKDLSLRLNKSLSEFDEISDDINLPTFVRTKIWEVASMLEKLQ